MKHHYLSQVFRITTFLAELTRHREENNVHYLILQEINITNDFVSGSRIAIE
ncbi:hypothetical protein [Dyadobacter psychrotolerans]|uniref:hypothetical protein n=1 Tax=Dyadobacter psychrotolerans TaxID=2541721 RepID=UPI001404583A|nr:hypothetical protein [Dyadobacter psychrotolerans]